MRLLVLLVNRASEPVHAFLFHPEMHKEITFEEINKSNKQLDVRAARRVGLHQFLHAVDIRDQHPVLRVEQRMPCLKLFGPNQHNRSSHASELPPWSKPKSTIHAAAAFRD